MTNYHKCMTQKNTITRKKQRSQNGGGPRAVTSRVYVCVFVCDDFLFCFVIKEYLLNRSLLNFVVKDPLENETGSSRGGVNHRGPRAPTQGVPPPHLGGVLQALEARPGVLLQLLGPPAQVVHLLAPPPGAHHLAQLPLPLGHGLQVAMETAALPQQGLLP